MSWLGRLLRRRRLEREMEAELQDHLERQVAERTADLQRIIAKCTAKDADERYQGMKDIGVDLRAARRRLDSASGSGVSSVALPPASVPAGAMSGARRMPLLIVAAAAVVALANQGPVRAEAFGVMSRARSTSSR